MGDEITQLDTFSKHIVSVEKFLTSHGADQATLPLVALSFAEKAGHWVIQHRHAFILEQEYRSGEAPGFRDSFTSLYSRLPLIAHPTTVNLLLMEDGIHPAAKYPLHGPAVAATAGAVEEALTGEKHLQGILYNRAPYEDTIGSVRKALLSPPVPDRFKADNAEPSLKTWLRNATYNVVSTSTSYFNNSIITATEREKAEKLLIDYFGKNTVFIRSIGNDLGNELHMRHSAYANHPQTLLIGACQSSTGPLPSSPRLIHMESYSSFGPDLVCETTPLSAHFLKDFQSFSKTHQAIQGTSFSAPQAAVMVQVLLRRFAVSAENPNSVLPKEDILLALRQTAQPIHVREYISFTSTPNNEKQLLHPARIGDHYVSAAAGCGSIDIKAAWQHLERMEQAVKEGHGHIKPRRNLSANLLPQQRDSDGNYRSQIKMKDSGYIDLIFIDADMQPRPPNEWRGSMSLVGPDGTKLELYPSDNAEAHYRIARTSAFYGVPMTGDWTLLSTKPMKSASIRFHGIMEPDHVSITHKPSESVRHYNLFKQADFRSISHKELDQLLLHKNKEGAPTIACHDFSTTGFPPAYLELRLLQLASNPAHKEHALALAKSGYPSFKIQESALTTAITKGDCKAAFALFAPNKDSLAELVERSFKSNDNVEIFSLLARNAGMTVTNADGVPVFNRLVQEAQHNIRWDRDDQLNKLKAVIDTMHQQGTSILQPDNDKKTVLDYVLDQDIWYLLQQGLTKEKHLAEVKRQDEQFSLIIEEFVAKAGKELPETKAPSSPSVLQPLINALHNVDISRLRKMLEVPTSQPSPPTHSGKSISPISR